MFAHELDRKPVICKVLILSFLQLWVAYAPCGSQHKDAVQVTLEQIDLIKRFINQYPNHLRFVNDSAGNHLLPLEGPTWRWRVSEKKKEIPQRILLLASEPCSVIMLLSIASARVDTQLALANKALDIPLLVKCRQ